MTIYGLLTFCAVYALAAAVPGPVVAAVIARGITHGLKDPSGFIEACNKSAKCVTASS